jgi:hypothetical protein
MAITASAPPFPASRLMPTADPIAGKNGGDSLS